MCAKAHFLREVHIFLFQIDCSNHVGLIRGRLRLFPS